VVATVSRVRITHKVDYGVRAMTSLAVAAARSPGRPLTRATLAAQDGIPPGFLEDILQALRSGGLLRSQRGSDGGWQLARPAEAITVADVIRALEGPLASVRGVRPHELPAAGDREPFVSLWIAVRSALRSVLEEVTIADLANGRLPPEVARLAADPESWTDHRRS
jgi:Rrf2 family protein